MPSMLGRYSDYRDLNGRNWSQPTLVPQGMGMNQMTGMGGLGGRRLPQPPPEAQKAMAMPLPNTPLPMSQKPISLSTRNRRLPRVPSSQAQSQFPSVGVGVPAPGSSGVGGRMPSAAGKQNVRNSRSFNMPFGSIFGLGSGNNGTMMGNGHIPPRTGRGAKLPVVPGTVPANTGFMPSLFGSRSAMANRRHLPDRAGPLSRSLDTGDYYDQTRARSTLETVVEAGRGVRKLPAQPNQQSKLQPVPGPPTSATGVQGMGRGRFQTGSSAILAMNRIQGANETLKRPSALQGVSNGYAGMNGQPPAGVTEPSYSQPSVQFAQQAEWT